MRSRSGAALAVLRIMLGLEVADVARAAGISSERLGAIETLADEPNRVQVAHLVGVLAALADPPEPVARTAVPGGTLAGVEIEAGIAYGGRSAVTYRPGMSFPISLQAFGGMTIDHADRLAQELAAAVADARA